MKKVLFAMLCLVMAGPVMADELGDAFREAAKRLTEAYDKLPNKQYRNTLAVLKFSDDSALAKQENLGFAFSELFAEYLTKAARQFRVVERKQIVSVVKEVEFTQSGLIAPDQALDLGKMLGADLLVIGSVFETGDQLRVSVRLVEAEKGEVLLNESLNVPKTLLVASAQELAIKSQSVQIGYKAFFPEGDFFQQVELTYNYDFTRGLGLGLQVFYGFSQAAQIKFNYKDNAGSPTYDLVEKSTQELGMAILLKKDFTLTKGTTWGLRGGPLLTALLPKYWLQAIFNGGSGSFPTNTVANPTYLLFGGKISTDLSFDIAKGIQIFGYGDYQFIPILEAKTDISWIDNTNATAGVVHLNDKINLSGFSGGLGLAFLF